MGEQSPIEVSDSDESPSLGLIWIIHLAEQATEEVVGALFVLKAIVHDALDRSCGKKVDVLGEHGNHSLQNETLSLLARNGIFQTTCESLEELRHFVGGLPGNHVAVVIELRLAFDRKKEIESRVSLRQFLERNAVHRFVQLAIKS